MVAPKQKKVLASFIAVILIGIVLYVLLAPRLSDLYSGSATSPGVCMGNASNISPNPKIVINSVDQNAILVNSSILIPNGVDLCLNNSSGSVDYYIQLTNKARSSYELDGIYLIPSFFKISDLTIKPSDEQLYTGYSATNWTALDRYILGPHSTGWQNLGYNSTSYTLIKPYDIPANTTAYLHVIISVPNRKFSGNLTFVISAN